MSFSRDRFFVYLPSFDWGFLLMDKVENFRLAHYLKLMANVIGLSKRHACLLIIAKHYPHTGSTLESILDWTHRVLLGVFSA